MQTILNETNCLKMKAEMEITPERPREFFGNRYDISFRFESHRIVVLFTMR